MAQAIASAASVAQRRAVAVHVCLGDSINARRGDQIMATSYRSLEL